MFFASPKFPRVLTPDSIRATISRALDNGTVAYVGKAEDGAYEPFIYKRSLSAEEVEISDDVYLIKRDLAEEYIARAVVPSSGAGKSPATSDSGTPIAVPPITPAGPPTSLPDQPPQKHGALAGFQWSGEISPQRWMNFYTKVLSRFVTNGGLRIHVTVDVMPPAGTTRAALEETKVALRELGVSEVLTVKSINDKS